MTKLQKTIVSFVAGAAIFANTVLPALAVTIEITGNGPDSSNTANVDTTNTTYVSQTNVSNISNNVDASSNTGYNSVEKSTGGDVSVKTGDATTTVNVTNATNTNAAEVNACCANSDAQVVISGNGPDSTNKVDLDVNNSLNSGTAVIQNNTAHVDNNVDAYSSTGKNEVDKSTGGDVSIDTGDATTDVTVSTLANANSAMVGGNGDGGSGLVSLKILGNGPDTDNKIYLDLNKSVYLAQNNKAHVDNNVDAKAKTGGNEIDEATGGAASIETGDASTTVTVDNMVNFNWADVASCGGCLWDVTAKIAGNGPDTYNKIKADLTDELSVLQNNCGPTVGLTLFDEIFGGYKKCKLDNNVDATAKSGGNEMDEVTGGVLGGDPSVDTGDAATTVDLSNSGNENVYGSVPDWTWQLPEGFNLNLSLDLTELLHFLHLA